MSERAILLALTLSALLSSCGEEGLDVLDVEIPAGYELSAGTASIFMNSSKAYDSPADWVSGTYSSRFNRGDKLYDDMRTSSNGYGGGLGPVYAGYSCGSCHSNAGRTKPAGWADHGSGPYGFSSALVYVTRKNGAFFQGYGRVIHDQSIYGVTPEGKFHVEWDYQTFAFPDGETYELAAPTYTITDWYLGDISPDDLFCTVRIPLRHVGMGQIMSLDTNEIETLARKSNYPEYGISGRCNYITERGVRMLGLSGNKAQHADLTVELGFSSDMGVTNSRYPEEICEGQLQMTEGSMMGLLYDKLDVSTEDMENVDLYMQCLGVPARRMWMIRLYSLANRNSMRRDVIYAMSLPFIPSRQALCFSTVRVSHGLEGRPSIPTAISSCTTWVRKSWGSDLTITTSPVLPWGMSGAPRLYGA